MFRIGHGFDVHKFGDGDFINIGGVQIPFNKGLIAHSDGDVALHALIDALLGASGLGDIGKLFPDTDMQYKNADSRALLKRAYAQVQAKGYKLSNLDLSIIAEAPKMRPFIDEMCRNIANDLSCELKQVNVKATTTEKLGFTGRGEGIACEAVVLLVNVN